MTEEQFEILKQYEENLFTSLYGGYCRNLGQHKIEILDGVFVSIFNKSSQLRSGCNYCVLESMKALGTVYFKYKAEKTDPNITNNPSTNNKPKRGRPTKAK